MSDATFHFAEEYVQRGFSVIPLVGKTPPAGFRWAQYQRRRTSLAEIRDWFGVGCQGPYNVGIVTGQISGITVVDIDSQDDLRWWTARFLETPLAAVTGGAGAHFYYRASPEDIRNRTGIYGRKIDIRSNGGYVVAPPSVHPLTGKVYRWLPWQYYCLDEIPLFDPAWLELDSADSVTASSSSPPGRPKPGIRNGPAYISHVYAISGQGGHNATFRAACVLRDAGLTRDEALRELAAWNETNCQPKWSVKELTHKVHDAFQAERQ